MIGGANKSKYYVDLQANQEQIFTYFYTTPDFKKRYKSPFRQKDSSAGCRFEKRNGIIYFVDNAGYNGRIFFNAFEFVKALENVDFEQALERIHHKIRINEPVTEHIAEAPRHPIVIKIDIEPWQKTNFFGMEPEYLRLHPVFAVKNYYCNTREDMVIRQNRFGIFKKMFAYVYPSGNIKLYFPGNDQLPFYNNCTSEDVFFSWRLNEFSQRDDSALFIVKSPKDALTLDRWGEASVISHQSETSILPDNIIQQTLNFAHIYHIVDPDSMGDLCAKRVSAAYERFNKPIFTFSMRSAKDPFDVDPENLVEELHSLCYDSRRIHKSGI